MAGFIHGKLDIKLLVLYLTSRLAGPVDFATLTDLAMCDDGVDYFVYAEAVSELVDSGHITQKGQAEHRRWGEQPVSGHPHPV